MPTNIVEMLEFEGYEFLVDDDSTVKVEWDVVQYDEIQIDEVWFKGEDIRNRLNGKELAYLEDAVIDAENKKHQEELNNPCRMCHGHHSCERCHA